MSDEANTEDIVNPEEPPGQEVDDGNRGFHLIISRPRNLKTDILSGLTVSLALVPEAVAFSFVAGVNPKIGLYAACLVGLITAIFGGRPGMISGATGAVAVIFAPLIAEQVPLVGQSGAEGYLFAAVALMGVFQILFGVLKFGKFVRLIPHPVMLGFVNGLAIVIGMSQLKMFQMPNPGKALEHAVAYMWLPADRLLIMVAMVIGTMAICYLLPKLTKAVPAALTAIVVVTLLSMGLRYAGFEIRTVLDFVQDKQPDTETLAASLPSFQLPNVPLSLETFKIILPYAALAAAVGLIGFLLTLTLVDELTDTRGRGNKECVGQGLANIVNGFFGGMGGCAMIGQSMINIRAGGRGRTSGITAAVCLILFIVWGPRLIEVIPLAALAGVMFMVVIATFEWTSLRIINKIPRSDAFVLILVSAVTVLEDLAIAVLVGVVVSALTFAWKHGKQMHARVRIDETGKKIYQLDGPLFFGSVSSFKELFDFQDDPEHVVIDFTNSRVCDHSGLEALNNVTERYAQKEKQLHLLNLSRECSKLIRKAENIVEVSVVKDLNWHHIADDDLD